MSAGAFEQRLHNTPLTYQVSGGGWRIGATPSLFLVAEGPGWSRSFGEELFAQLANGRKIDRVSDDLWKVT